MSGNFKKQLKHAFNAPAPTGRDTFLAAADFPRTGRAGFLLAQLGYIRKRVWAASLVTGLVSAAAVLWLPSGQAQNFMWMISALLPLVALTGILEMARSASHQMEELEASCKYSLSHIVLARLCALGAANTALLLTMAVLFESVLGYGFLRTGVYIFLPFLLTCALSLYALNHLRPADGVYACAAISVLVGMAQGFGVARFEQAFVNGNVMLWALAGAALLMWTLAEIRAFLKQTENLNHNLYAEVN